MNPIGPALGTLEKMQDRGGAAQPLLQVNGLTKHFPVRGDLFGARKTVRAVDDVSFAIAKGETLGIVGESGCGKSTTARLLMHLMKRDAGDIIYDGMQVGRALSLRELRRGMQMFFQDSYASLNPRLTVDETVSALDKSVEAQVLNLLVDLKREFGLTYLFISHDLHVVRYISDRVVVMYLGEVVELGPVDRVWDAPAHPYTRALLAAMPSSDPDNRTQTPPISGDPPNPIDPPSGCRFHTRCPFAEPVCATERPRLSALDTMGHQTACYMAIPGSAHSRAPRTGADPA